MFIVFIITLIISLVLGILFLKAGVETDGSGDFDIDVGTSLQKGWFYLIIIILVMSANWMVTTVPSGNRGVVVTFGSVGTTILDEGLSTKLPWQNVIYMKTSLQVVEVSESTASADLQEVTTILAVHYNVIPGLANEVYREMRKNYESLLLVPVMQEDLKAITAQYTAEELVTKRSLVVIDLTEKLRESLEGYGIYVQTINIVDFQFSESFSRAIDDKVTAEQEALKAKNELERIRWEQEQNIVKEEALARQLLIQAQAEYNQTVVNAQAQAEKVILDAHAEAEAILLRAEAKADAISMISGELTPEYNYYQWLLEWNGILPNYMLGEDTNILLSPPS